MSRNFKDWISAYTEYASYTEAPTRMHFFTAVVAVAGALRRKVWMDMAYFRWFTNHYLVLVAPPGIVSKSTTASIAMNILREVPGIKFGPEIITWPALVQAFAEANEQFDYAGAWHTQCALTLESSEFGNLVNPEDREMIDLLVNLWDSRTGDFKKVTKGNGTDTVQNPFINLVACTTPAWIAGNFPDYVIGGGFTSRCLFVYAEEKQKLIPYPDQVAPKEGMTELRQALIEDLTHIATNIAGPYKLSAEARAWGSTWYEHHHKHPPEHLTDDRFSGYLARKQTHIHKLAMVLAAAQRDELEITKEDLILAHDMVSDLEKDMQKVFAKIGRTEDSIQAERFISHVRKRGLVSYSDAYQYIHAHFPNLRDFEGMLNGAIRAGLLGMEQVGTNMYLRAKPVSPPKPPVELPPGT